jgi:alpha-N-acetylgalactosaminidase
MKFIADKLSSMGMKFGMYTDIGTHTCQGYTGLNMDDPNSDSSMNEFIDQMFEWGFESLKVDGCFSKVENFAHTYPKLSEMILNRREALNKARLGKAAPYPPLMLSCSWPAYQGDRGLNHRDMSLLREHCNLWRNQGDINDSFVIMRAITDWYAWNSGKSDDLLVSSAGPGNWNDPDMLLVGNNGLSIEQQKTQFNLWAIMASPLYISADVRTMSEESLNILKNK